MFHRTLPYKNNSKESVNLVLFEIQIINNLDDNRRKFEKQLTDYLMASQSYYEDISLALGSGNKNTILANERLKYEFVTSTILNTNNLKLVYWGNVVSPP